MMSHSDGTDVRTTLRVYMTGGCDGAETLHAALAGHPDLEFVGASENINDAAAALAGGHLQVVLHATRSSSLPKDELASIREHTRAPVVLVASGEASRLLDEALEADVSDVLLLPQLADNIVFSLRKAAHTSRKTGGVRGRQGTIVTVFSPKGGTGKTVVATSLAATLATAEGKKTLLLDLDLQFGDAAIMLGVDPEKTIYDLVVAPGELDSEKLSGYTTHHPCGLEILPAPLRPEDAELVTEAKLARLLEVARESYDVIVVDTSPFFHGPMLATLDRTDELFLLCGLDLPTLKNVKLALQTLEMLSFPRDRIRIVLNRANSKVGMKPGDVEDALGMKIRHHLPSDRGVPLGVNMGKPVVLSDEGNDFSRALRDLAKSVLPTPDKTKKRSLLRPLAKA
jgi:pilus assembly protein CpaE